MTRGRGRAPGRLGVVLATTVVVVLVAASPAGAHSSLLRSDPPDGGLAAVGRQTLSLWFTEPISVARGRFTLVALDGTRIRATPAASSTGDETFVRLETPPLPRSTYRLEWSVIALDDGHPTNGTVVFGVGVRPETGSSREASFPGPLSLALRWTDLAALLLMVGALAVAWRVLGAIDEIGPALRRRALGVGALAAGLAAVCGALTPFDRTPRGGASFVSWVDATRIGLTDTTWGRVWSAREAALAVVAVSLCALVARRGRERLLVWVTGAALVAVLSLEAWAGHASALPRQRGLGAAASAAHLAAAGAWAGGLAVLAVCLLPLMRRRDGARWQLLLSAWRRFSPLAAVSTVVLVATGLYEAGREVPDLGAIGSTVYGAAAGAKVGLLALALAVAGLNTLCVNPRLAAPVARALGRPPGWTPVPARFFPLAVVAELAVLAVAVGAAAVLTEVSPAREVAAASRPSGPAATTADGVFVTFESVPAGAGMSLLIVRARATVRPQPAPIDGVEVSLESGEGGTSIGPVPLDRVEPGRYEARTVELAAGTWLATVALHRGRQPAAVARLDWRAPDTTSARAGPLEVVATVIAATLLLALIGVLLRVARQARRRDSRASLLVAPVSASGSRPDGT